MDTDAKNSDNHFHIPTLTFPCWCSKPHPPINAIPSHGCSPLLSPASRQEPINTHPHGLPHRPPPPPPLLHLKRNLLLPQLRHRHGRCSGRPGAEAKKLSRREEGSARAAEIGVGRPAR